MAMTSSVKQRLLKQITPELDSPPKPTKAATKKSGSHHGHHGESHHGGQSIGKPNFGMPYWDWAEDGELSEFDQWQTELWSADYLGESRNQIVSGRLADMRVRLELRNSRTLLSVTPRPIERNAGRDATAAFRRLPTRAEVNAALLQPQYDVAPYSRNSSGGHRNLLEGWEVSNPGTRIVGTHNLVHVWVGGDMAPGSSPNDPVFFLNHCNVDRIWESWMNTNGRLYAEGDDVPVGHRLTDPMNSLFGTSRTPQDVLETLQWYDYDSLVVA